MLNRIRKDLSLTSDSDYSVLLAIAEKLKPGSYVILAGDPLAVEKVNNIPSCNIYILKRINMYTTNVLLQNFIEIFENF